MRQLFVSYQHPQVFPGGSQQIAYEMFQAARARGHDAYLVSALESEHAAVLDNPEARLAPAPDAEGQYFYIPRSYNSQHFSVGDGRAITAFRDLVAALRPDVVHFHHYHHVGIEAIRAARMAAPSAAIWLTFHEMLAICMADGQMLRRPSRELCRAATPIDCHGCFPYLQPDFFTLRAARLRALLDECDGFVFPSRFLVERYLAWGLDPDKCHVVANGLSHPAPSAPRSSHSPAVNRFAFFGQYLDHKGVDVVLEALLALARSHRLPATGLEFLINGGNRRHATDAYRAEIDRLLAEIDDAAGGRIEVRDLGGYGREQIAERMQMTDWVIAPSTWQEVFGLVVSEAWMFGRPVIVSDIAGLGERVDHGVNGLKFPLGDSSALADIIAVAVGNDALWLRLHEGAQPEGDALDMFDAHIPLWLGQTTEATMASKIGDAQPSRGTASYPQFD